MIKRIVKVFIFLGLSSHVCFSAVHGPLPWLSDNKVFEVTPEDVVKLVTQTTRAVDEVATDVKRLSFDTRIKEQEKARQELAKRKDKGLIGDLEFQAESKTIEARLNRLEQERTQFAQQSDKLGNNVQDVLMTGWKTALEVHKEEQQRKTHVAVSGVNKALENEGSLERLKFFTSFVTQPTILLRTGGFVSLTGLSMVAGYYTLTHFYKKLGMPRLIKESSIKGWKESFLSYFVSREEKDLTFFDDSIFDEKLDIQMRSLAESTKQSREKGLPYRHTLLYGRPGTGKTSFARKLAVYLGMDYVIIPGGNFGQFSPSQQIVELNHLFSWAKNSPRGMLIIIDEIDAFLRNRENLTNDEIKVLNTFLEETGKSSTDYLIMGMTNLMEKLDPAARNRFPKKIYFPLPALAERTKILKLYFDRYVIQDRRMLGRGDQKHEAQIQLAPELSPEFIESCAQQMDNWSGREIEQLCEEWRIQGYYADQCLLTKTLFDRVLTEKMDQHKAEEKLLGVAAADEKRLVHDFIV